jgi:hypothetical protein
MIELLDRYSADGRALDDEILVRIDGEVRPLASGYVDGTLVLVAGMPLH